MWARALAMRLAQMGRAAHVVGDATAAALAAGDLLLLISGSGRTATLRVFADKAREVGAEVGLLTYRAESPLAAAAQAAAVLAVPMEAERPGGVGGRQLLGTLFDQCALLAADAIAAAVAARLGEDDAAMQRRHANLE